MLHNIGPSALIGGIYEIPIHWQWSTVTYLADGPVLILGLHPTNERRRYKVTPSLIGWAQT